LKRETLNPGARPVGPRPVAIVPERPARDITPIGRNAAARRAALLPVAAADRDSRSG
ncbi:MAG: hypothetical protein QOF29_789, partial [bacterium]